MDRKFVSSPQVLCASSAQHAGRTTGGAPGMDNVSLGHIFVPHGTGAASLAPPSPPPLLPPRAVAPDAPAVPPAPPLGEVLSEELPQAGTATAATKALTNKTRTARTNMGAECSMLG